ncbi:hypothetical protein [Streptomyces sp. NPDC005407]|uniref:hypothetical protein n=1 Tax=Streptomyces sp. NPDC005407 TaxID=3155340 RepID=UPI0033AAC4D6
MDEAGPEERPGAFIERGSEGKPAAFAPRGPHGQPDAFPPPRPEPPPGAFTVHNTINAPTQYAVQAGYIGKIIYQYAELAPSRARARQLALRSAVVLIAGALALAAGRHSRGGMSGTALVALGVFLLAAGARDIRAAWTQWRRTRPGWDTAPRPLTGGSRPGRSAALAYAITSCYEEPCPLTLRTTS